MLFHKVVSQNTPYLKSQYAIYFPLYYVSVNDIFITELLKFPDSKI